MRENLILMMWVIGTKYLEFKYFHTLRTIQKQIYVKTELT